MSVCTVPVIVRDTSKVILCTAYSRRWLTVLSSNNVVDAAWDAGIGVFALIWVRRTPFELPDIRQLPLSVAWL